MPEEVCSPGKAGLHVHAPLEAPKDQFRTLSLWWRLHRLLEAVRHDPITRAQEVRNLFDPLEATFIDQAGQILKGPAQSRGQAFRDLVHNEMMQVGAVIDEVEKRWKLATA